MGELLKMLIRSDFGPPGAKKPTQFFANFPEEAY